jgi:hypothetical protein
MVRLTRAWRALGPDQRLALGAAVALLFTMLLPWYQQNGVVSGGAGSRQPHLLSGNLNAFQVFSFVEAAVLVVALAVAYMLFARAEGREFQLPGGDGTVVLAAGLWTALLLIYRLFDKPGISSHGVAANVGVQWGIFFALAAAGLMAYAGSRMRHAEHAAQRPGHARGPRPGDRPSGRSDRRDDRVAPAREDAERPARAPAPDQQLTALEPAGPARPGGHTPAARARPRYPPAPAPRQLSFDEEPAPGSPFEPDTD